MNESNDKKKIVPNDDLDQVEPKPNKTTINTVKLATCCVNVM